jgi:hypothetical protein
VGNEGVDRDVLSNFSLVATHHVSIPEIPSSSFRLETDYLKFFHAFM